ncbi:MAG: DUF4861 family protein [candidate division KSB1 bacterium]|nr:DUF4861 family protein [candidate division KSB1 bacterium]
MSYWQPKHEQHDYVGCGVIIPQGQTRFSQKQGHVMLSVNPEMNRYVYYAGAGWSKSPDFQTRTDWDHYLKTFSMRLSYPLELTIE